MGMDRIESIGVQGMRCLGDAALELSGLTVLIGENGSGKSTFIEGIELLRKAATQFRFGYEQLVQKHGGLREILRRDADDLNLYCTVGGGGPSAGYFLTLSSPGGQDQIVSEVVNWVHEDATEQPPILVRNQNKVVFGDGESSGRQLSVTPHDAALYTLGMAAPDPVPRLINALRSIEIHSSFDTRPLWMQAELQQRESVRFPDPVTEVDSLNMVGSNLPSCFHTLRNAGNGIWEKVLENARLGLGESFQEITTPSTKPGHISVGVRFTGLKEPVPIQGLSEGQISYLAFVAMAGLLEYKQNRSLIVIDEPELHLHPSMLARVVGMLEEMAEICPVIVATHSERFLDCLSNPAESVVLCELDEHRATKLLRPDPEKLKDWLQDYRGIGHLRSEGYESQVFKREV